MFYSPLRYPGGKNKLSAFIAKVCLDNNINNHYVEPYAGGCSVALFLLLEGFVKQITINDKDRSIYAFWHSVLYKTEALCELIRQVDITIDEWRKQKQIQKNKEIVDLLSLGFSTLFLNRTNRSGIINGGMIGGVKQNGKYLIDCRFNKEAIINRIIKISEYKDNIRLYCKDALELVDIIEKEASSNNVIFYFDPPYYLKADSLYMNHYISDNHALVSEKIKNIKNIQWIVSYDNVSEIRNLYKECNKKEYSFKHTAYDVRIGKEILFFSPTLKIYNKDTHSPIGYKYRKTKTYKKIIYKDEKINKAVVCIQIMSV